MGIFRDFFTGLWNDYIGVKLDAITGKFKSEIGDKITLVTSGVTDVKKHLDTKIGIPLKTAIEGVTSKLGDIKDGVLKIPSSISEIKTALGELKDKLPKPIATFIDIQTWFNPLLAPLKTIDRIHDIASGKKPDEIKWVGEQLGKGVKAGVKLVTDAALANIQPILDDFYDAEGFPQETRDSVNKIAAAGEFGLNAVVGFMLGHFLSPVLSTSLAPVWEGMGQEAWKKLSVRNVDPATLIRLKYKGLIKDSYFVDVMKQHGYNSTTQKNMLDDFLWLPTVGDVIRWSVREAFYDDYSLTYGLDKEYPTKLNEYGVKIGISNTELKYFWRSHWELPSIMMGYEMLHRDIITTENLDNLFMAADIMPFWRDKLKAISYHVYTRVDVRRLFRDGIIDRDTVKRNYKDQGYDEEHAENLTAWTVHDTLAKEKDLTRSHIERLYKEGQLSSEQAKADLRSLGYDDEESKLLLMLIDIKLEDTLDKDLIATWSLQFKLHIITLDAFTANIDTLNVTLEKKNRLIAKAQLTETRFITQVPKADLMNWLSADIISEDIFKAKMAGLGYLSEDIERYILELTE